MNTHPTQRSMAAGLTAIGVLLPILAMAQNYVFGPNVRVNDDPAGWNAHSLRSPGQRLLAARGDTVYVTWKDRRPYDEYYHAYFVRSTDGGRSFGPNVRLDNRPDEVFSGPSLALDDSGGIHVCWSQWEPWPSLKANVLYVRSDDGGQHFTTPIASGDSFRVIRSSSITVSHSGRRVYVARDQGVYPHYNVFLSRSTDGGRTFQIPGARVNADTTASAAGPAVCVLDDTIVMVAWQHYPELGAYFARSLDGGATFGPSVGLNDTAAGDSGGALCTVGADTLGGVYVIFYNPQYPGGGTRLAVSLDTGRTFFPGRASPAGDMCSSLWVTPDGKLFVAWDVNLHYVLFSFSPDRGTTFLPLVRPSDEPGAAGMFPSVAANLSGRAFVAWEDGRDGYADIYLAAGELTAIQEAARPRALAEALGLSPNPGRGPTTIGFLLRESGPTSVSIFDLTGRQVKALSTGYLGEGRHVLTWDGRDSQGKPVRPGVYFIRVETQDQVLSTKLQYLGS